MPDHPHTIDRWDDATGIGRRPREDVNGGDDG